MSQIEYTGDTSEMELGLRRENYLRWRQRLADRQEDLRSIDGEDGEPITNPEWSPDALFRTDDTTTAPIDVVRSDAEAAVAPVLDLSPGADDGWDRTEVEALLRQFRARPGSPRAASRAVDDAIVSVPASDASSIARDLVPAYERDDQVVRYFDRSRVVRTSTVEESRHDRSIGERLRELNRRRLEGELDDAEFDRRKRALFFRGRSQHRSST